MASSQRRSRNRPTPTQTRAARRARQRSRSRLKRIAAFTAVGLIAGLFILSLILPSVPFGGFADLFGSNVPDGPGQKIADQGRNHVVPGQEHAAYNSVPATSGWHYNLPLAPVDWAIYEDFVADEYLLHNLEHGGIGIHYNCPDGCDDLVRDLSRIANRALAENLKVVLSPYPDMPTRIALTAWTFLDAFEEFDEGRVVEFIETHESSPTAPENQAR